MSWPKTDKICCKNPTCDGDIETSVAHCSTHNFKALRNAFLTSSECESTSRYFLSKEKTRFTWKACIEECYLRDQVRSLPQTHLTPAAVRPNYWNKTRVGEVLRAFSEKTLVEQFACFGKKTKLC